MKIHSVNRDKIDWTPIYKSAFDSLTDNAKGFKYDVRVESGDLSDYIEAIKKQNQ
ncbi:hypothetical protein [Niabella ginsenosidivorans]|nr:hypothetical protein [Niabella ginsenosidivorans]